MSLAIAVVAASSSLAPALPSLSVIIPAYNERLRLPETLEASLAYLRSSDRTWECIVVDDGSEDGTGAWAAAQHPGDARLRVLSSPLNCGKGAALQAGADPQEVRGGLLQGAPLFECSRMACTQTASLQYFVSMNAPLSRRATLN